MVLHHLTAWRWPDCARPQSPGWACLVPSECLSCKIREEHQRLWGTWSLLLSPCPLSKKERGGKGSHRFVSSTLSCTKPLRETVRHRSSPQIRTKGGRLHQSDGNTPDQSYAEVHEIVSALELNPPSQVHYNHACLADGVWRIFLGLPLR